MQDFGEQIAALRPMLLDFAHRILRNDAWAEDAVSETLVAALERPEGYRGSAAVGTWLVAILKHKAVDQIRHHTRELQVPSADAAMHFPEGAAGAAGAALWAAAQDRDPQETAMHRQFLGQLALCMDVLPPRLAQAFILRNALEEDTAEICAQLGVNQNNLGVMLHRANHRLRALLQGSWAPAAGEARFT